MSNSRVYLSRRNLLTLLSKLDRQSQGDSTACTIIKRDNVHPTHPQSMKEIEVIAVEDDVYYADRAAGEVHPSDEPKFHSYSDATEQCNEPSDYDEMTELDWAEYQFATIEYDYNVHPQAAKAIRTIFKQLHEKF